MRKQTLVRAKTKVAAAVFAAAMTVSGVAPMVSMTVPVMAEGTQTYVGPVTADSQGVSGLKKTIGIKNVDDKDSLTVTAYQLVKGQYAQYTDGGTTPKYTYKLTGYALTGNATAAQYNGRTVTLEDLKSGLKNETDLQAYVTALANSGHSLSEYASLSKKDNTSVNDDNGHATSTWAVDAEPGLYLVLIKGSGETVYNPVLLSVGVTNASDVATDLTNQDGAKLILDLNTAFKNGGTNGYMKKSETGFDKNITNVYDDGSTDDSKKHNAGVENKVAGEAKGDALAIGDTAEFKIDKMVIPSYSDDYKAVQYKISDTLESTGFDAIKNIVVKVAGTEVKASETDGTVNYVLAEEVEATFNEAKDTVTNSVKTAYSDQSSKKFTVAFSDAFIRANAGKSVEITYQSTLATTAGLNYSENYNHAELEYSNNPTDATKTEKKTENTYHYTFGIDAEIDGEAGAESENNWGTYELNKVTKPSGASDFVETKTTYNEKKTYTKADPAALAGAEFTLYTDAACTTKAQALVYKDGAKTTIMTDAVTTSDANGHISFLGLDEGTYYMKETAAPAGYTGDSTIYQIVIDGTFDEDTGIMTKYSIVTNKSSNNVFEDDGKGIISAVGKAEYSNDLAKSVEAADGSVTNSLTVTKTTTTITPVEIVNSIQSLPFTGGEGRQIILVTSAAAVGIGVMFLVLSRKKKEA